MKNSYYEKYQIKYVRSHQYFLLSRGSIWIKDLQVIKSKLIHNTENLSWLRTVKLITPCYRINDPLIRE